MASRARPSPDKLSVAIAFASAAVGLMTDSSLWNLEIGLARFEELAHSLYSRCAGILAEGYSHWRTHASKPLTETGQVACLAIASAANCSEFWSNGNGFTESKRPLDEMLDGRIPEVLPV